MTTKLNKAQLEFVEKITKSLDEGIVPWRATWEQPIEMPYNASTNTSYKGLNLLSLWITQNRQHFDDPRWMTFKQANDLGYKIKPGSKGTSISYWSLKNIKTDKLVTKEEYNEMTEEEREDIFPVSKSYVVFNAAQIFGIPELTKEERKEVIFENEKARSFADRMRENMDLEVLHRGSSAYYSPTEDQVVLPPMDSFMDEQAYYATYLHEMAHATSHPNRLSRKIDGTFGTSEYAEEELRAEITASFLSLDIGFHFTEFHEQNHQSYIRSWSQKIKDNPSVIFNAIKEAQEIREYMLEKGEYELIYQQGQEKKMSQPLPSAQITKETLENPQEREVNDIQKYAIYKESTEKDFDDEIKNGNWNGFRLAEYRTEEGQDISYHGSPLYSTIHQFTDLESGKEYRYDDADRFARKNIVFHEIENDKVDLSALKQSVKNNIDELQKEIARLNEQMQNIEKAEVVFNDLIHGNNLFQERHKAIIEAASEEQVKVQDLNEYSVKNKTDHFLFHDDTQSLQVVYFNPDGNDGQGIIVIDNYDYDFLREYSKQHGQETLYDSCASYSKQINEDDLTQFEKIIGNDSITMPSDTSISAIVNMIDNSLEKTSENAAIQVASRMVEKQLKEIEMPKENYESIKENNILEKEAQIEPETDIIVSSEAPQPAQVQTEQAAPTAPYYAIDEAAAKRAKNANSFSDYKQGSATAEYRHYVDEAVQLAEWQKQRVDPMYHEKINSLLDTYARKLAANMNKGYEIDSRVPSIMIAGGSNFSTRKKEKQNAARDNNYREWEKIQGLLDKIRSTGMGGISADDPQAVQKLEKKLENLEKSQETMKAVNAYYRKHNTLDGCPHLPPDELEKLKADMEKSWHLEDKPFASWALSNNTAEIRRLKDRIKSLSQQKEIGFVGWNFNGGKVEANTEANRLQILFENKPDEDTRNALKRNGFRWSPKAGAWQRQLTYNAYFAADFVKAIAPLSGQKPTELQRAHTQQQKVTAQEQTDNPSVQTAVQTEEPLERSLESSTPSVEESPQKAKSKKEQLEDMKNSVSIAEYARDVLGYHLVRMGRGKMGLEEFESCVIYPNNTFYRFSVGVGGSIIDFIKLCEECDTREAIHKLENYYYQYSPEKRFDTNENLKEYNYKKTMLEGISVPERNSTNKHVYSYLTKTRCIKPSIVNDYLKRHLLYEDTHKNCVFLGKLDNTILYGFSRSTGEKRFTQDLNGSIKEVGIYVDNNSDVLVVNEAVIDQMSYMSMLKKPQKFNYLSVNGAGNAVNAVRFHMKKRPEAKQLSSVIIGLDNDEAGIENTEKLIEYLKKENPNIEVLVHQPTAKDFNEQLQNEMQVLANAAPSAEEALAAV